MSRTRTSVISALSLIGAPWHTSTRSQTSNCVEVAPLPGAAAVRDSKDPAGPALLFAPGAWTGFIAGARKGQFGLN